MAAIVKLSSFSLETVGRTVSSGAGAECAHSGSVRGPGDARPETKPRAGGGFVVTTIDFRTERAQEIGVLLGRHHADEATEAKPRLEPVGAGERRAEPEQATPGSAAA
jgi:hypothetical protein